MICLIKFSFPFFFLFFFFFFFFFLGGGGGLCWPVMLFSLCSIWAITASLVGFFSFEYQSSGIGSRLEHSFMGIRERNTINFFLTLLPRSHTCSGD
jgi:uncharacterized membrane protein YdbT with pleckstrin-like domain